MTSLVISQPVFFPWPGFFSQLLSADHVVWLDDAQFSKGWFTNRCQISNSRNQRRWLTIPVSSSSHFQSIHSLQASHEFSDRHKEILHSYYHKFPFYTSAMQIYEDFTLKADTSLVHALVDSVEDTFAALHGYRPPSILSSSLKLNGRSSERVLSICKQIGASRYITGHGARNYLDHEEFEKCNIKVSYMNYSIAGWRGDDVNLSILDLIASVGLDNSYSYYNSQCEDWRTFTSRKL